MKAKENMINKLSVSVYFSKDVEEFLENKIFKEIGIKELNNENIDDITSYIFSNYEIPLSQGKLTKEEKRLLNISSKAVSELPREELLDL